MDEGLELLLKRIDPLHGVQRLETWMLHRILDIRQGIKGEELGGLR